MQCVLQFASDTFATHTDISDESIAIYVYVDIYVFGNINVRGPLLPMLPFIVESSLNPIADTDTHTRIGNAYQTNLCCKRN